MGAKWQRVRIDIPDGYSPLEREAIGQEIVDFIRDRVQNRNLDKKNRELAAYSDAYARSLDFKIAGKSKNDVNLTLSGDMLGALTVLSQKKGSILIGWENGTPENAKADGNIRGTYGQSKQVGPKRDILGLTKEDLAQILDKFTPEDALAFAGAKGASE